MLLTNCYDEYGDLITHYTQWDINQTINIDIGANDLIVAPTVHFANVYGSIATEVQGTLDGNIVSAQVPNELLQEPYALKIHVYAASPDDHTSQKTLATITVPVRKRAMPESYTVDSVAATAVSLNLTSVTLSLSGTRTQQLIATVTPYNATSAVVWSSSNTSIATVSDGLVTATGSTTGSCNIVASCGSVSKTCSVTVTN